MIGGRGGSARLCLDQAQLAFESRDVLLENGELPARREAEDQPGDGAGGNAQNQQSEQDHVVQEAASDERSAQRPTRAESAIGSLAVT